MRAAQVGGPRSDDDRARAEGREDPRVVGRVPVATGLGRTTTSRVPCTATSTGERVRTPWRRSSASRSAAAPGSRGPPDDHAGRQRGIPAECGRAGDERVVAPSARRRRAAVRARPRRRPAPPAARPRPRGPPPPPRRRCGGERDAAPEAQHALDEHPALVLVRGERRQALLEHVGRDAHELDGLPQRQPPGEVTWRDAERLGRQPDRLGRLVEPGHEVGDAALGHEQHGGTLVRGEPAEPRLAVHRRQAGRSEVAPCELEAAQRGRRRLPGSDRAGDPGCVGSRAPGGAFGDAPPGTASWTAFGAGGVGGERRARVVSRAA